MNPELIVVVLAAVAVVGLVGLSLTVRDAPVARKRPSHAHKPGPFDGAMDVIDRSVGMYVVRRLTGRPTTRPSDFVGPATPLTTDEVAVRSGAADEPVDGVPILPMPSAPAGAAATAAAARAAAANTATARTARTKSARSGAAGAGAGAAMAVPAAAVTGVERTPRAPGASGASAPRERLIRDAGIALIGLTVVGLVAFLVWPQGGLSGKPAGTHFAVVRASATAKPTASQAAVAVVDATPSATAVATPGGATPAPTPDLTAEPTPSVSVEPTASPLVTPKPTPKPTAKATAVPTPKPTAVPTPKPTPAPTPKPTPTPIAAPHAVIGASCSGFTVDFTGSGSTGETSYLWDFDDGGSTLANPPPHTYGSTGTFNVILTVKGPGGQDSAFKVIDVPC